MSGVQVFDGDGEQIQGRPLPDAEVWAVLWSKGHTRYLGKQGRWMTKRHYAATWKRAEAEKLAERFNNMRLNTNTQYYVEAIL